MGLDLAVPDHTTLSRRASTWQSPEGRLGRQIPGEGPVHIFIDSTGVQVYGAGQWQEEKHGAKARQSWRTLHLALDADRGEVIAHVMTDQDTGDATQVEPLLDQISIPIRMADAPLLADLDDNPNLRRLIVRFEYQENYGGLDNPLFKAKGDDYVLAATFYRQPSQLDIDAAIAAARMLFPEDGGARRWLYSGHEIVRGDELCSFEQEQVAFARRYPEAFNDNEYVYGVGVAAPELSRQGFPLS